MKNIAEKSRIEEIRNHTENIINTYTKDEIVYVVMTLISVLSKKGVKFCIIRTEALATLIKNKMTYTLPMYLYLVGKSLYTNILGICNINVTNSAKDLGIGRTSAHKYIKDLEKVSLIQKNDRKLVYNNEDIGSRFNTYYITGSLYPNLNLKQRMRVMKKIDLEQQRIEELEKEMRSDEETKKILKKLDSLSKKPSIFSKLFGGKK